MASYLVEGGPSKDHARTKALMYGAPDVWDALLRKLAGIAAAYLEVQVEAGASAVQLFDSWAGALTREDYRAHVHAALGARAGAVGDTGVPRIHFGVGTGELLDLMGEAGADVVGVDWRVPLADGIAARRWPRRAGQPRPDAGVRADRGDARAGREVLDAGPPLPGTSSTSGTACSRRPTPTCSPGSRDFVHEHSAALSVRTAPRAGDGDDAARAGTPSRASTSREGQHRTDHRQQHDGGGLSASSRPQSGEEPRPRPSSRPRRRAG